MTRIINLYFMR